MKIEMLYTFIKLLVKLGTVVKILHSQELWYTVYQYPTVYDSSVGCVIIDCGY